MTSTPTSTNPNPDNSLACPISPSASSISGSEYYGIGLAAMTASPEPSHSPSTESIQARVLGSPDSDPIDPSPDPDSTTTTDGPKTKLAVHKALVQFPQPTIVNYARPFRGQHQSLQQQQEVPPLPSSTPSPTSPSDDLLPPPNFGVPFDEESFQILTPDLALLGSSTQRQRRLGGKTPSPAPVTTQVGPIVHSPTSTDSSDGPITPHESPELDQDATVVPTVPTWRSGTPVTESNGLGIDKVQQDLSGVTVIQPLSTPSQPMSKTEYEDDDKTPKASDVTPKASDITPKAIDTRRQAIFNLIPAYENDERRHVNDPVEVVDDQDDDDQKGQEQTPRHSYRDSAFVATAMILESYEDEDETEVQPDSPRQVKELTSSSTTSSLSGNTSSAFEYASMLSSSSMASLDSAADVREMRQVLADEFDRMCQQNRPVGHVSAPSISSSIGAPTEPSSRVGNASASATGTASSSVSGSKIKRKAVPAFLDLEADGQCITERDAELEMSAAQRAFYGVRAAAQSVTVLNQSSQPLSRSMPGSASSNSLSSILTSSSSSESPTQPRTPLSISAPVLISSTSALVSGTGTNTSTISISESREIQVKHVPREFHVNGPVHDSAPAPFGGGKRGDSSGVVYMTRREAAEKREQEEKDKAAKVAGATIRQKFGKMFRSAS